MSPSPRREREKNELREKILAATRTLLVEGGLEAVTMREVAKRVEYSPAALYQHFPDKEALVQELCRTDFADFAALFLKLSPEGGPLALLCRTGFAYFRFAREFPEHYHFMFLSQQASAQPESDEDREDPAQNAYVFLRYLIAEALEKNLLREDLKDVDVVAQTVWAAVHGVAALDVCRRDTEAWVSFRSFDERARESIRTLMMGLARSREQAEAVITLVFAEPEHG